MRAINPGNIPRLEAIGLDGNVLIFTSLISIFTGFLFGLAPALRAAKLDLNKALKAGGRNAQGEGGFGSGTRRRLRSLLVVAEVAISLMLLVGAGLLVRSFVRLQNVSPGFEPGGVVSMRVGGSARQFPNRDATFRRTTRTLNEQLAAIPGVEMRGAVSSLPFTSSVGWGSINVEGWTPEAGQELQVDQRAATPDYFRTMRDSADQGTVLLRRGHAAERGTGRHHRREVRAAVLAQRRRHRQAHLGRPQAQDPHRRRRRHREAVRSRHRRPHRVLSADDGRLELSRRAHVAGSRRGRRRDSSGRSGSSIRTITVFDVQNDVGPDESFAGAAAVCDVDAGRIRASSR